MFEFGGSTILLFVKDNVVSFDEDILNNSLNGNEIRLQKVLTPTGFAGSSFNRIELYKNGDVYWIQYNGTGVDYENIPAVGCRI